MRGASLQSPPSQDNTLYKKTQGRRLDTSASSLNSAKTFLLANQTILILMLVFVSLYGFIILFQKYMDKCLENYPKCNFYTH